ncbi:MAG TPA: PIN domain-containing protein [Candidatus Methylomirabilis sp.]|nr:PIN domain-containing protein [Candidatus Methylomirabilis sp.]
MGLIEDLGRGPIGLDTAVFIYFIEEDPHLLHIVEPLFAAIDRGILEGVTSSLTLLEVLVVPYRVGDFSLAERYEALLTRSRGLRLVDLDRALLRSAALLRATLRLKAPDAIQIAAALAARCPAFLTSDRKPPPVPGLKILQLRDYLGAG